MRMIDADELKKCVLKWLPKDPCGREEKEMPFETDICVSMLMEIEEQPTIQLEQRWIPVRERLPKQYQEVLICGGQNVIKCAQLIGNIFECDEIDLYGSIDGTRVIDADTFDVSAWMPLPKPYQSKSEVIE